VVLTEAATGYYALTPLIAALAGAKRVYALTRDSRYGTAREIERQTIELARRWNVSGSIEVLCSREDERVKEADIVTNLGFVRPLNAAFLRKLKSTVVISLMWETWEYRPEDLDLSECRQLNIPVLGTNEHHRDLQTFSYIGHIALKLLYSMDVEVFDSRVVVIGSGEFAEQTTALLRNAGAHITCFAPGTRNVINHDKYRKAFQEADALVMVDHDSPGLLIGPNAELRPQELVSLNPGLVLAHICGGVDEDSLKTAGLRFSPSRLAPAGHMSVATDFLGPKPLIDLHAAGLKVGQVMAEAVQAGLAGHEAERCVLNNCDYAQGFSHIHN
jgi:hypothetical protein